MLPPTVAMFLICGDAVSDDGHAVADGQRLGRQYLFIRHQKRRGRVARAVEVGLRGLLRQGAAKKTGNLFRLAHIDAQNLGMGIRAAHQRGVSHIGQRQIVGILARTRGLVHGLKTRHGVVDNVEMMLFHHCCASFPFAYCSMTLEAATMASSIFV